MNQVAKDAVRERISLGYTKNEILSELEAAGYPPDVADALYTQVATKGTGQVRKAVPWIVPTAEEPAPPQPPGEEEAFVADQSTNGVETTLLSQKETKNYMPMIVLAVVILLVLFGLVYGLMSGGFQAIKRSMSSLFNSAPYATEAEMMEGLVINQQKLTAHGFNFDLRFAIEEREEGVRIFDTQTLPEEVRGDFNTDLAVMIESGGIPAEAEVRWGASGLLDVRDEADPKFDVSANLNVLAEPFIINAAGSARLADGVLYGRIDDIPANFEAYLGGIPIETWVILESEGEFGFPVDPLPMPVKAKQTLNLLPPEILTLVTGEVKRLLTVPVALTERSRSFLALQAAQLGAAPLLDASMSKEEAVLLERSIELLKEHPPIMFVGEPEQIKQDGETAYQYEIDIDFDNLQTYLLKLVSEGEAITGETVPLTETELRASLGVARPILDEFNRLTDIVYAIRPDGTTAGFSVKSTFTFDHPDMERQFRFEMDMMTTRQNDVDITAPEDVYEKTMEEIMKKQMENMISEYSMPTELEDDSFSMKIEDFSPGAGEGLELVGTISQGSVQLNDTLVLTMHTTRGMSIATVKVLAIETSGIEKEAAQAGETVTLLVDDDRVDPDWLVGVDPSNPPVLSRY